VRDFCREVRDLGYAAMTVRAVVEHHLTRDARAHVTTRMLARAIVDSYARDIG
jgi:hypothetical protein